MQLPSFKTLLNVPGMVLSKALLPLGLTLLAGVSHATSVNSGSSSASALINHVFIRLDVDTIAEISKNEFMQTQFSDFFAGESGDLNNKWNAVYIQGDNTYLELFDSNGSSTQADVGLAFGLDKRGQLKSNLAKFSDACTQPYICEVENRVRGEGQPVWFQQFKVLDADKKLDTWIMEYGYEYIKNKPTPEGSVWNSKDVSRKRYNAEWFQPGRLLKDIEHIYMTVTPDQYKRLELINKHLGPAMRVSGSTITDGVTQIHVTVGSAAKVNKIIFSLNRKTQNQKITMGRSTLVLQGDKAQWSFR